MLDRDSLRGHRLRRPLEAGGKGSCAGLVDVRPVTLHEERPGLGQGVCGGGRSAASCRRTVAVATDRVRWSGSCPVGSTRRTAISRAWRWTAGSCASSSDVTSASRSVSPPRVRLRSDSAGAERRRRAPPSPARRVASPQMLVLPMPASPMTRRLARPPWVRSTKRSTASSSPRRPITSLRESHSRAPAIATTNLLYGVRLMTTEVRPCGA